MCENKFTIILGFHNIANRNKMLCALMSSNFVRKKSRDLIKIYATGYAKKIIKNQKSKQLK